MTSTDSILIVTFLTKLHGAIVWFWFMVFNTTFNSISVRGISWRTVLFVEDTRVLRENHRPVASHWQTYHIMLYQVHLTWVGFKLTMLVVKDTICIGSYISNYHMIMIIIYFLFSDDRTLKCSGSHIIIIYFLFSDNRTLKCSGSHIIYYIFFIFRLNQNTSKYDRLKIENI
jgi:hypothetical protein